ncbi:somatostatin receptor type 5-like [Megalobrama amblycephala]|uniref:somatostatin receptor type 5-like n=1 Tax=Megalobrama amblycephala TaxID=75352 RepID=UPI0020147F8E|nr:somatostatin receptor type 5-like [Megalobrama amblycephala]
MQCKCVYIFLSFYRKVLNDYILCAVEKKNTEEMNNSTVNFTTPETSTNSTTQSFGPLQILEMCLHSISFVFGLPTHTFVTWFIMTRTASGFALEFFFLNLSVSEIGNCLNSLINLQLFWYSGLSTLKNCLTGLTITGRPLFQCLICVEHYLAVVHPVTFLKYKPLRYRVICCTAAWIITLGSCLSCMFIVSLYIVYLWFLSLQFLLFVSIQLFCLVAVLRALKQSGPGERGRKRKEENNTKRRAFYLILITTATMVIIYVPLTLTALYTILTNLIIQEVWFPSVICYVLAGFVQPVLYLHRTGKLSCLFSP